MATNTADKSQRKYQKRQEKEAARYMRRKQEYNALMARAKALSATNPAAAAKLTEKANHKISKISETVGDKVFNVITTIILLFVIVLVGYPLVYVVSASFSSTNALKSGLVTLWPVEFTLSGYQFVLDYKQVWIGYRNSIFYTVTGVLLTMSFTILAAYPLSRKTFQGRSKYMMFFYFTTLFSAGMIPNFLLKTSMGMYNTVWPILLQGTVAVQHIIILRTAFSSSIPGDLFDAARIDGANDFQCLFKIALPLAKATLSVLILYVIVGAWNEYFTSMIYLEDTNLHPLQLVLRPIMTASTALTSTDGMSSASQQIAEQGMEQVRYALIIIATLPALIAYWITQKSFKTGVMVGSVKG